MLEEPEILLTNTQNTPIEAVERAYPMRVVRYRLRRGSSGAGLAPGGDGIERDLLMLEDVTVSLITERAADHEIPHYRSPKPRSS